jgi:hypothetical protein
MSGSRGHIDFLGEISRMRTRVIIEYDLPCGFAAGDRVVVRDQVEQRWTKCETVLALPGSATVTVELPLDRRSYGRGEPIKGREFVG